VRLDFRIEPATAEAIRDHAGRIDRISGERVREELEKMLAGPDGRRAMGLLFELGLAEHVFGSPAVRPEAWSAGMARLDRLGGRRDPVLSLAAVLGDVGVDHARGLCGRWGASNSMRNELAWLVRNLPGWTGAMDLGLADFKRMLAHRAWDKLLALWRAEEHRLTDHETLCRRIARRAGAIDPEQISPPPLVTGQDIIAMGVPQGPRLGRLLRRAYDLQLGEELQTRKQALETVRQWLGEQ
jgi:poly(A) polymerase